MNAADRRLAHLDLGPGTSCNEFENSDSSRCIPIQSVYACTGKLGQTVVALRAATASAEASKSC